MNEKTVSFLTHVAKMVHGFRELSRGALEFTVIMILGSGISNAQYDLPNVPDSLYLPNQILIMFDEGVLNETLIGGYGERDDYPFGNYGQAELPVSTALIQSESLVGYLTERGVTSLRKVVPWIDPLQDTLSISRLGDTIRTFPYWNILLAEFNPALERNIVLEAYSMLALHYPLITWAQPNFKYTLGGAGHATCSSTAFEGRSWLIHDDHWSEQISFHDFQSGGIDVEPCWSTTTGSPDIRTAIIDDGIVHTNPDFTDKLYFPPSQGGKKTYSTTPGSNHHGTQMAGIIGARTDNSVGVVGTAGGDAYGAGSKLYILDIGGSMSTNLMVNALAEAVLSTTGNPAGFGCHLVNLSLYNYVPEQFVRLGVADAYRLGASVFACSGNDATSNPAYPASFDNQYIVAVGGKDEIYRRYAKGNYGSHTDFMGPAFSSHIYTTVDDATGYSGGETSAATAHATGTATLLISAYNGSSANIDKPYFPEDIENLLEAGAVDGIGQLSTVFNIETGWGYLNARNTIGFMLAPFFLKHFEGTLMLQQSPPIHASLPGIVAFQNLDRPSQLVTLSNVKVYRVATTLSYPESFVSVTRTWGIGNQRSLKEGYCLARIEPNSGVVEPVFAMGYTNVTDYDASSCEVETYFYKGTNIHTNQEEWVPYDPVQAEGIKYFYSVLGVQNVDGVNERKTPRESSVLPDVFPNPVIAGRDSYLHVRVGDHTFGKNDILRITDCLGRVRQQVTGLSGNHCSIKLDADKLASGPVVITLFSEKSVRSRVVTVIK